ncbi:MAG: hypothetical protein ABEJ07_03675 [Candidatus Nanohaloarchaea archaeon]
MSYRSHIVADASFLIAFDKCDAFKHLKKYAEQKNLQIHTTERIKSELQTVDEDNIDFLEVEKVHLTNYKYDKSKLSKSDASVLKIAEENDWIIAEDERYLYMAAKEKDLEITRSASMLMKLLSEGIINKKEYGQIAECFIKDLNLEKEIEEEIKNYPEKIEKQEV